jgi:hypothetical protein
MTQSRWFKQVQEDLKKRERSGKKLERKYYRKKVEFGNFLPLYPYKMKIMHEQEQGGGKGER